MQLATEAEIVQNSAVAAALLWAFTEEFMINTSRKKGPTIPLALVVLPVTFHEESVDCLHRRVFQGGLDLALAENRTLAIDLQERLQAMTPQTMRALHIAFGAGLMGYNRETGELQSNRRTDPFKVDSIEVRKMLNTARRLGYWLSTISPQRLGPLLRIRL